MDTSWMDRAACKGQPVEIFTYDTPVARYRRPTMAQKAVLINARLYCVLCPVADECFKSSIDDDYVWTVRGGRFAEFSDSVEAPDIDSLSVKDVSDVNARISMIVSNGFCNGKSRHVITDRSELIVKQEKSRGGIYLRVVCHQCKKEKSRSRMGRYTAWKDAKMEA